jgi:hypothetical protein
MENLFVIKTEIRVCKISYLSSPLTHITLETKKMSHHPRRLEHGTDNCITRLSSNLWKSLGWRGKGSRKPFKGEKQLASLKNL